MIQNLLAIVLGFILLGKGADFFVDGAVRTAKWLGISQIVIGLTIVAMGTSIPEAAVSIVAAINSNAEISIGNIIGSNILNILLILGISSVLAPIAAGQSTIHIEIPFMIFASFLLFLFGLDETISRLDAFLLSVLFLTYFVYLLWLARKDRKKAEERRRIEPQERYLSLFLLLLGGITAVMIGSKLTVYGATRIARWLGVSERLIGLTIVALGTSLPELVTSVNAARKGNADIAIGNIVGSNIFNILFILGVTGLITPIPYAAAFLPDSIVMILSGVVLFAAVKKAGSLTRPAGILLLFLFAGYSGLLYIS